MESNLTYFCLQKIKDFFNYIKLTVNRKIQIPNINDEHSSNEFISNYVNNINIMESEIIKPFDRGNHYTRMYKMIGRTLSSEEKALAFKSNIRVIQKLPKSVKIETTFIPNCDLNIIDIFESDATYDLFEHVQNLYAYCKYYLKIRKQLSNKESEINTEDEQLPSGLFGEVKYPSLSKDKQNEVYEDVRKTIGEYNSSGLDTALNEVIKELETPGAVNEEEGMNTIDSSKLMGMATNVASKLTDRINNGDMSVPELVSDTENFINDLMKSPMFDGHPDNEQIKSLFSNLMNKIKFMNEADQEENSMLVQDVDKILGLNEDK